MLINPTIGTNHFKQNCLGGCPCDEFNCIETTTAPTTRTAVTTAATTAPSSTISPTANAVLVLSTENSANKPLVVGFDGTSIYFL